VRIASFVGPIFRDRWVRLLALLFVLLSMFAGRAALQAPAAVDWHTIGAIAGLLVLAKALELSGYLDIVAHRVLCRARNQRQLALGMVFFSALLSAWVTNDVTLFVVLPLTLSAGRMASLPVARLATFEALAVNAGSSLTAIGNPQNLILWHLSGSSLGAFVLGMAPLSAVLLAIVAALAVIAFSPAPLRRPAPTESRPLRPLLLAALVLYVLLLSAMQWGGLLPALGVTLVVMALVEPGVLRSTDWALVVALMLMFADVAALLRFACVHRLLLALPLHSAAGGFWSALLVSQLVSNVPASIALAKFSPHWRALAFGANVGGFGLALGSLANLIALRAVPGRGSWATFHVWSIVALLLGAPAALAVLRFSH